MPHQRQCFFANGNFWLFWSDVSSTKTAPYTVFWRSSPDGITWGADSAETTFPLSDADWDVCYDAGLGKLVIGANISSTPASHSGLKFRQGTPNSNGTITWDTGLFQTAITTSTIVGDFSLAIADDGHLWIVGTNADGGSGSSVAYRNANTDGTWAGTSGFPVTVHTDATFTTCCIAAALTGRSMPASGVLSLRLQRNVVWLRRDQHGGLTSEGAITA